MRDTLRLLPPASGLGSHASHGLWGGSQTTQPPPRGGGKGRAAHTPAPPSPATLDLTTFFGDTKRNTPYPHGVTSTFYGNSTATFPNDSPPLAWGGSSQWKRNHECMARHGWTNGRKSSTQPQIKHNPRNPFLYGHFTRSSNLVEMLHGSSSRSPSPFPSSPTVMFPRPSGHLCYTLS
jgi:hypothetical protein